MSTNFFTALVNDKESAFQSFSGTLHCEACLASLLAETSLASKDISARMKASPVSTHFYHLSLISCERVLDQLLGCQSVAAQRVNIFSLS
jgi:hypothetical protein